MKWVFRGAFALLSIMSVVAWRISPQPTVNGKTILTWTVDENESRQQQVRLFNQQNPSYEVRIDANNSDSSKVIVQSLAGVGPDLFCCYSGGALSAYVKADIAWDITDELPGLGIDVDSSIWKGPDPCFKYERRVYGFPNNAGVDALWINKEILAQNNVPCPDGPMTWDEFIPIAKKLTVFTPEGRPKYFGFLFQWGQWQNFLLQWGGRVYSKDGTRCEVDCAETIAATQFMQDLIYKYKVSPSPEQETDMATAGGWGSGGISWFGSGRGATALGGRWWLMLLRKYEGLSLGVAPSPHGPHVVYAGYGKATLINKNSPRRKEALAFLKWMIGPEYNALINHQGDALGPVKKYAFDDSFLHDPDFPAEDYNAVWRDVMKDGISEEVSPFINGNVAARIIYEQLDLVKSNYKSAAEAMKTAAQKVNEEIQRTIEREPALKQRWIALTSREQR